MIFSHILVFMRGGGDLGTGAAVRLVRAGFPLVVAELEHPLAVRRTVALSSAVRLGEFEVEGVRAVRAKSADEARTLAAAGVVPVLVDLEGASIPKLKPRVLLDARMTKSQTDTNKDAAPLVVGLGPGFNAGVNCHAVIETNRGHSLGHVYWKGKTEGNTGRPDVVMGVDYPRVLRAPKPGIVIVHAEIGDAVVAGQMVATVDGEPVCAPFAGVLRGIIADATLASAGQKIGDLDPRGRREYCFTVSDKSLAVGGGVLEAILTWLNRK